MPNQARAAVYVEKGGVGKTTSAAHLAVAAHHDHNRTVLLVDLAGTQNDLATHFGYTDIRDDIDAPISAVFGDQWDYIRDNIPDVFDRMVFDTGEGPDLIPADPGLGGADNQLANVPREDRYHRLNNFLDTHATHYDLVILDLPGKEDNIALNGLFAAENIVAPLKPGAFERNQLRNLEDTLAEIRDDTHDADPRLALVFATMIDRRTTLADEFVADLEAAYPDRHGVPVPISQNIGNEQDDGQTLFALPDDELYSSGERALDAYRENTRRLLETITHD